MGTLVVSPLGQPVRDDLDTAQICAVIVTHHPDRALPARVERIAHQVDAVVIVDNRSSHDELSMLRELCATSRTVGLIANPENRGVAAALNQGIAWGRARGYTWALTLDQDTTAMDGLVRALAAVHAQARTSKRIAVIGSNYLDGDPKGAAFRAQAGREGGPAWIETATVLTSGSAVSLPAWEVIGPFRDELFIDHVDHEYCLRARAKGFSVLLAREPLMAHAIGAATTHRLWGREFRASGHPVRRWYFRTRNLIVLVRRYWRREFHWVLAAVAWHVRTIVVMVVLERERPAKLREVMMGAWDGLRGRLGPHPGDGGAAIPCVGGDGRTSA
jgi:rhamnosyltransferase